MRLRYQGADFLELALLRGHPPKVIWLNLGNIDNTALKRRLLAEADTLAAFLAETGEGVLEIE